MAQQYANDLLALREQLFTADMHQIPLPTLVEVTADKLVAFMDDHRGFNHLFGSVWGSPEIAAASARMREDMVHGITQVITDRVPQLEVRQRVLAAQTLLHIIQGILPMVEASRDDGRLGAVAELKRAWLAYLAAVIAEGVPDTAQ